MTVNRGIGKHNAQKKAPVDRNKICLLHLIIKLGLVKNSVEAMDFSGAGLKYIQEMFGAVLIESKVKACIFVDPQVHELIRGPVFVTKLSRKEKPAWKALAGVIECFPGSYKAKNYQDIVANLYQKYKAMGCRMLLKLHCYIRILIYFHLTVLMLVMNEAKELTRKFL